jgi:hypothetical protein
VPVRVLGEDETGAAVEPLGSPLAEGDSIVLAGADVAFPGAPLRAVTLPPPTDGKASAAAAATSGGKP